MSDKVNDAIERGAMSTSENANAVQVDIMAAKAVCISRGVRLTKLRQAILEVLLEVSAPIKAYEIIEKMRDKGERLTPATVYRVLDFLLQCGLVHRINALNAFIPCTGNHEEHSMLLFVCSQCQHAKEMDDPILYEAMRGRLEELGMSLSDNCIEIQGTCRKCIS